MKVSDIELRVLKLFQSSVAEMKATYGDVVQPIGKQQVYFGRLTAHGYSQYGNTAVTISKQIVGTSDECAVRATASGFRNLTTQKAHPLTSLVAAKQ